LSPERRGFVNKFWYSASMRSNRPLSPLGFVTTAFSTFLESTTSNPALAKSKTPMALANSWKMAPLL